MEFLEKLVIQENADLQDQREVLVVRVVEVKRVNLVLMALVFLVLLVKEVNQATRVFLVFLARLVELEKRGKEVLLVNLAIEVKLVILDPVVHLDLKVQLVTMVEEVPREDQVCLVLREKRDHVVTQETWAPSFKAVQVNRVMKVNVVYLDQQDQRENKVSPVRRDLKDLQESLDPLVNVATLDRKESGVNPVQKDLLVTRVLPVRRVSQEKEVLMDARALSGQLVILDTKDHLDAVFPDPPVKRVNLDLLVLWVQSEKRVYLASLEKLESKDLLAFLA